MPEKTPKQLALEYSRQLPTRQYSPYGALGLDAGAIQDAFRKCYEELARLRRKK